MYKIENFLLINKNIKNPTFDQVGQQFLKESSLLIENLYNSYEINHIEKTTVENSNMEEHTIDSSNMNSPILDSSNINSEHIDTQFVATQKFPKVGNEYDGSWYKNLVIASAIIIDHFNNM